MPGKLRIWQKKFDLLKQKYQLFRLNNLQYCIEKEGRTEKGLKKGTVDGEKSEFLMRQKFGNKEAQFVNFDTLSILTHCQFFQL